MSFARKVGTLLWKDLLVEVRTREMVTSMFVFSLLVMVIFNFAMSPGAEEVIRSAPGILWIAFTFAGMLGLNRSFALEKDRGSLQGILLCPVDRSAIYLGKVVANLLFITGVEAMILLVFTVFFNFPLLFPLFPWFVLVILLATIGLAVLGTLFSAIACNTRMREVMLPVLLLPLSVPVIVAAVKTTAALLSGAPGEDLAFGLRLLGVYDVVFLVVALLVFEYVVEE